MRHVNCGGWSAGPVTGISGIQEPDGPPVSVRQTAAAIGATGSEQAVGSASNAGENYTPRATARKWSVEALGHLLGYLQTDHAQDGDCSSHGGCCFCLLDVDRRLCCCCCREVQL